MDDPLSTKTTEVTVTLEDSLETIGLATYGNGESQARRASPAAYSVTITSDHNKRHSQHESSLAEQSTQPNFKVDAPPPTRNGSVAQKPRANFELNSATWSYTKCALLFFTALLVTWIPSSANRVYSLIHTGGISLPLEIMSALVLPLQGFWNAIIYIVTSWSGCKIFFSDMFQGSGHPGSNHHFDGEFHDRRKGAFKRSARIVHKGGAESESMTELANDSRPASNEERNRGISAM